MITNLSQFNEFLKKNNQVPAVSEELNIPKVNEEADNEENEEDDFEDFAKEFNNILAIGRHD